MAVGLFRYLEETIAIDAAKDELFAVVSSLLEPAFCRVEGGDVSCCVAILDESFQPPRFDSKPWRAPPVLMLDGIREGAFRLVEHSSNKKILFRHGEADTQDCWLTILNQGETWTISVPDSSVRSARSAARLIKYLMGCLVRGKGAEILHASCAQGFGKNIVFFGDKGAGKTSFLFRSCFSLGAKFVSDDTSVCIADATGGLVVSGWPRRIALSLSALDASAFKKGRALSRNRESAAGWDNFVGKPLGPEERKRLLFDTSEFLRTFSIGYSTGGLVSAFVFLQFDDDAEAPYVVTQAGELQYEVLLQGAAEMKMFTDYLGIVPAPKGRLGGRSTLESIANVPAVSVKYNQYGLEMVESIWSCIHWRATPSVLDV